MNIDGNGEQTRDLIHVNDIVEALILALQHDGLTGEALNVCISVPTSVNQLAATLKAVTGKILE